MKRLKLFFITGVALLLIIGGYSLVTYEQNADEVWPRTNNIISDEV